MKLFSKITVVFLLVLLLTGCEKNERFEQITDDLLTNNVVSIADDGSVYILHEGTTDILEGMNVGFRYDIEVKELEFLVNDNGQLFLKFENDDWFYWLAHTDDMCEYNVVDGTINCDDGISPYGKNLPKVYNQFEIIKDYYLTNVVIYNKNTIKNWAEWYYNNGNNK